MMKRLFLILLLLFSALTLSALRSGDDTAELSQVKWLRGNPRSMMLKHNKERRREYSIAVFMLTNTPDAAETLRILDQLAQRYARMIQISVITPDPEQDAQRLLSKVHTPHLSFGIDSSRQQRRIQRMEAFDDDHGIFIKHQLIPGPKAFTGLKIKGRQINSATVE